MIVSFLSALSLAYQPLNLGWVIIGTVAGLLYGVIPGLGGVAAMSLLLPFTYGMDTNSAMFLLAGIMGSVPFGGSVTAILINTPGTSTNAATCFDGYPMTQRGEADRALGISATASACGALFGVLVLIILMPVLKAAALLFGPPEFFALILFGLASIVVAARGDLCKGLLSGVFGILLSFLGVASTTGTVRYGFETDYLWDGIPLIPMLIGMFAIAELMSLGFKGSAQIAQADAGKLGMSGVVKGMKDVLIHWKCFLRSSAIGTIIGVIPGIGGAAANFISYTIGQQFSKTPEKFGTGCPEGIVAAESANNSKDGGALVPTVAFGIPGSSEMAVLLGAFILHGLVPGPDLLRSHLDTVWVIIIALVAGNVIAAGIGLIGARTLSKITQMKLTYIIPLVTVFCFLGAYVLHRSLWDVLVAILFGMIAFVMRKAGYSVVTFVIGFILGPLAETAFHQSLMISYEDYFIFFKRPLSLGLIVAFVLVLALPALRRRSRNTAS